MKGKLKRAALIIAGITFLILGVIGLALPFLQGFIFLAIGVVLISAVSPKVRSWVELHTRHYPKIHALVEKTQAWIVRRVGDPNID